MKKIALSSHGFIGWSGGLDYFMNIVQLFEQSGNCKLIIFVPRYDYFKWLPILSNNDYSLIIERCNLLANELGSKFEIKRIPPFSIFIVLYSLFKNVNAVGPLMKRPPFYFFIKWFSYVWDYQHKYMPQYFNPKEIQSRDKQLYNLTKFSKYIIVGSVAVGNDILKFNKVPRSKIISLPAMIPQQKSTFSDIEFVKSKYEIEGEFFICSNQFWQHKNHELLFGAFDMALNKIGKDVCLVCTGDLTDYRNPEYIQKLMKNMGCLENKNKIKILGLIPKDHQLALLKNSISLIQPTSFEGGPGGGSVYEALSFGVPVLLSDIAVNLEISALDLVSYFKSNDKYSLMESICELIKKRPYVNYMELDKKRKEIRLNAVSSISYLINQL